jgi:hypothetical protein
MMEALKVMTYFKISLSTHNWDSANKNGAIEAPFSSPRSGLILADPAPAAGSGSVVPPG